MGGGFVLGLTGGIGSGKSTVASLLAQNHAAQVVDADAISRGLTASGGEAIAPIAQRFGKEYVDASGAMDRQRMRSLVFEDEQARKALEDILHPMIFQAVCDAAQRARSAGTVVLDLPLLVESPRWRLWLDAVLVVDAPVEVQIARVQQRSQLSPEVTSRIIASQASRQRRLSAADAVIFNGDISLSVLTERVQRLARSLGLMASP